MRPASMEQCLTHRIHNEKIDDGTPDNQPAGNTGRVILTDTDGYFDIVKDSQTYTYVGEGNGDYIMELIKTARLIIL